MVKLKPSDNEVKICKSLEENNEVTEIIPRITGGYEYAHWDDYEEEEQEVYRNSWEEMESNGVYMRDFI